MIEARPKRSRLWAPFGVLALLGMLAVGCAKSENTGSGSGDGGSSNGTVAEGSADTSPDVVLPASGQPKAGGKLVYGLEAETDGWDPTSNRWATSGTQVALTIFDALVALDKDLKPQPMLAQSLTPNADFKEWTVKLRPNVKFHDGSPLNATAVKKSVEKFKASPLTGAAAKPIDKVEPVDDLTLKFIMNQAWAVFPSSLTGQGGVIPAPAMLDNPEGSRHPVGTGPFVFQTWTPDKSLSVTKNASYWRQGLPYLDAVEFRPLPDASSRYNSLLSHDIQLTVSSSEDIIKRMLADSKDGKIQTVRSIGNNDLSLILLNASKPPFDDIRARQALAYAIDRKSLSELTGTDPGLQADSVFQKDSVWYKAQPDYPSYDPEKAKALIKAYTAEKGPLEFTFGSTGDPLVLQAVQALQAQWEAVGIKATIKTQEQATYIIDAITGSYQANIWRQFGAADPDGNYIWWISDNANGNLALNMARNKDPQTDAALQKGRGTLDQATRKAAYDEVQARQTAVLPYIWLSHGRWTAGADTKLRGIQGTPLPDGGTSAALVGGVMSVTGMWFDT
jgi:peptide/nickel transport system substrate-binding protein